MDSFLVWVISPPLPSSLLQVHLLLSLRFGSQTFRESSPLNCTASSGSSWSLSYTSWKLCWRFPRWSIYGFHQRTTTAPSKIYFLCGWLCGDDRLANVSSVQSSYGRRSLWKLGSHVSYALYHSQSLRAPPTLEHSAQQSNGDWSPGSLFWQTWTHLIQLSHRVLSQLCWWRCPLRQNIAKLGTSSYSSCACDVRGISADQRFESARSIHQPWRKRPRLWSGNKSCRWGHPSDRSKSWLRIISASFAHWPRPRSFCFRYSWTDHSARSFLCESPRSLLGAGAWVVAWWIRRDWCHCARRCTGAPFWYQERASPRCCADASTSASRAVSHVAALTLRHSWRGCWTGHRR